MTDERFLEVEKDLYDIIGRLKGIHGKYLMERSYESIRNLALAGRKIMSDCTEIMRNYDKESVHTDIQDILGY